MLYRNINEFLKSLSGDKRIMCLDFGEKKIGIAFSDKTKTIATAHSIYYRQNTSKDLGYLSKILQENEATTIVIGLPLKMNGQENEWCEKVIQFANKLVKKCKVSIYLQDERLSTRFANAIVEKTGMSIIKSKKLYDKISACIILQHALDKISNIQKNIKLCQ
ncbi:Holliday junction resolvase RuvX [Wolbachia endosymbiont of Pentidionis agamae]|uniref:Holliday junction resolvase RuvX n=1 Tax=Wolbachia endosymbiont of Pentidionis agamae TaxID=3110435 RepID=UPI002FD3B404